MNGHKAKALRKQNKTKLETEMNRKKVIGVMDAASNITADKMISFLITRFMSKSGYTYISIGKYGSLFVNENSADIVPVTLHAEKPAMSVRGRYNDENRKDIVELAFHVGKNFPGLVMDRMSNVFIGGEETPKTPDEVVAILKDNCSTTRFDESTNEPVFAYDKVTGEQINKALELERPLIEAQLADLKSRVEASVAESAPMLKALEDIAKLTDEDQKEIEAICHTIVKERGYSEGDKGSIINKDGKVLTSEEAKTLSKEVVVEAKKRWDDAKAGAITATPVECEVIDEAPIVPDESAIEIESK